MLKTRTAPVMEDLRLFFSADDAIHSCDEIHESDVNHDVAIDIAEELLPAKSSNLVNVHIGGNSHGPDSDMSDQSSHPSNARPDNTIEPQDAYAVQDRQQRQQQPAQHLSMDANEARGAPDTDEQRTMTEAEPTTDGKGEIDIRSSEMALDFSTESVVTYLLDRSPSSPALDKSSSILPDASSTSLPPTLPSEYSSVFNDGTAMYDLPPPLPTKPASRNQNEPNHRGTNPCAKPLDVKEL